MLLVDITEGIACFHADEDPEKSREKWLERRDGLVEVSILLHFVALFFVTVSITIDSFPQTYERYNLNHDQSNINFIISVMTSEASRRRDRPFLKNNVTSLPDCARLPRN